MKGWNKRGQFYLLAAIIVIGVIVGFVAILNYSSKTSTTTIYDLGRNLEIESEAVMDYSKSTGNDEVGDFTSKFDTYLGQNAEVYFVTNTEAYFYDEYGIKQDADYFDPNGEMIQVGIGDDTYKFEKKPGDNFYFIILQEIGEEKYVITN